MKVLIADKTAKQCRERLQAFPGIEVYERFGLSTGELRQEIGNYRALIVRSASQVDRQVIEAGAELKVIGRAGAGVDNIDVQAAAEKGIVVMNTPGGNAAAVAELVTGLMFCLARRICSADASMKTGQWEKKNLMGTELAGKTLGLFGIGHVGGRVGQMAAALGMTVLASDPYVDSTRAAEMGIELVNAADIPARSDYISLHVPKTGETAGFVNRELIAKMKDGVALINCSRGGIIVEKDLLEALESGKVSGVGIDVYEQEPPQDLKLIRHARVIATPHIGASSQEAQVNVAVMVADQVGRYLATGEIVNAVN